MGNSLTSNMEDYLEAIAILKRKNGVARVRDMSHLLKTDRSNVAATVKRLSENGLVIHERYGYIDLTPKGKRIAAEVDNKHKKLLEFLTEILNIDPVIANQDACKMEHIVSGETLEKFTKFVEFVRTSPEEGMPDWLRSFGHYFKTGKRLVCKIRAMKKKTDSGK